MNAKLLKESIKMYFKHIPYYMIWLLLVFLVGTGVKTLQNSEEIYKILQLLSDYPNYWVFDTSGIIILMFIILALICWSPIFITLEYQDLKQTQIVRERLKSWYRGYVCISELPLLNGVYKDIYNNSKLTGKYTKLYMTLVSAIHYTKVEEYAKMTWRHDWRLKLKVLKTLNHLKAMLKYVVKYDLKGESLAWNEYECKTTNATDPEDKVLNAIDELFVWACDGHNNKVDVQTNIKIIENALGVRV